MALNQLPHRVRIGSGGWPISLNKNFRVLFLTVDAFTAATNSLAPEKLATNFPMALCIKCAKQKI